MFFVERVFNRLGYGQQKDSRDRAITVGSLLREGVTSAYGWHGGHHDLGRGSARGRLIP